MSIRYAARHVREDLDQASLPRCHLFDRTCLTSLTSLNRPSPGTLRNSVQITFGTELTRCGVDLVTVAELMGNASLETTRLYTRPSEADMQRAAGLLTADE